MDIIFLRTDENYVGKRIFTPTEVTLSNSADETAQVTVTWVEVDKQSNRPDTEKKKSENPDENDKNTIYSFKKEVESIHQDKRAAKKIRDKTNVLKENKRKKHKTREEYDKRHERLGNKETKYYKKHEIHKKLKRNSNEESDPVLNLPIVDIETGKIAKEFYEIDPVLNMLRNDINTRRQDIHANKESESSQMSSSLEMGNFKDQFKDLWLEKKYEALNSTLPDGDQVNMGGARKTKLHGQFNSCDADFVAVVLLSQ